MERDVANLPARPHTPVPAMRDARRLVFLALRPILALIGIVFATGCAVLTPRFADDVQTAVVRSDMRRLETDELVVYYPTRRAAAARRIASRVEACTRALRTKARVHDSWSDQKPRIVLADLPYNNAYVSPPVLSEPIEVLPAYNTAAVFTPFDLPPDPGVIGCHEAVHYVQMLQSRGIHRFFTTVFGSAYTPQIGLEPWFHEGLAVFYETKLQGGIGRLGTRYYEGILAAGVAGHEINGGWLHSLNRDPAHGGHYLLGAFFVDWLVRRFGENRLWELIERQAGELLPPIGVNARFRAVYGLSLTELIDAFAADLSARYPVQERPREQRSVTSLGREVKYARGPAGIEVVIDRDLDRPTRLLIRDASGRVLHERSLTDILPGRSLISPTPAGVSGLSFSPDGRTLTFVMLDRGPVQQTSRLVRVDVASGDLDIVIEDLGGPGGSIAADATTYFISRPHADAYGLGSVDLRTGRKTWLRGPEPGVYFLEPRVSPDGTRLLTVRVDAQGSRLAIVDAHTGSLLPAPAAPPGPVLNPSWLDDQRVLFVAESGIGMQVFVTDLEVAAFEQVSYAPYLALSPYADGGSVRFLNREGWTWTLDTAPLILPAPARPQAAPRVALEPNASHWLGVVVRDRKAPRSERQPPKGAAPAAPRTAAYDSRVAIDLSPVRVRSDEPYSQLDGLFIPQVRGPWFVVRDDYETIFGLGATGGDRLGYHRWAIGVGLDPASKLVSGQLDYRNALLAPVFVQAQVAHYASRERSSDLSPAPDAQGELPDVTARETLAVVLLERSWYDDTLSWGWRYNDVRREVDSRPFDDRRFAGPLVAARHAAIESTSYSGPRRGFGLGGQATYLPQGLSTVSFNVADLGANAVVVLPLPLSRRHTLRAALRGRDLSGAPEGLRLLQVGGGGSIGLSQGPVGDQTAGLLPPNFRFFEPLRGFEDLARYGSRALIGELAYRYPFIIDRGSASTLSFLPSSLLREIAIEPFGSGATLLDDSEPSMAVGASLDLGLAIWLVPIDLRFQVAQRLTDDEDTAVMFFLLGE